MQQFKKKRLEDRIEGDKSVITSSMHVKGTISGNESVCIAGRIEGDIQSDGLVWIEKGGNIKGDIDARHVIIEGKLNGNIKDAENVEIRTEAHISGNIQTQKIAMAEGSFFEGEIHMPRKGDKPTSFVEKRQAK
jgi:cytoskeletal protein CcmA (bactofilin family)